MKTVAGNAITRTSTNRHHLAIANQQSRVRGMGHQNAHETSPRQPTTATKTESSSPMTAGRLPDSPTID